MKRARAQAAREVILLLDSSKFGVRSVMRMLDLEAIHTLVTDDGAPMAIIEALRARGIVVVLLPTH